MQPKRTMPAACVICGQPTKRPAYPSRVRSGRAQTCSRECGGALKARRAAEREVSRFWAKVNKDGPVIRPELGQCWIWTGNLDVHGYGLFPCGSVLDGSRRRERAHCYAYELAGGVIPDGLFGCHHCDNPPCVRPEHIFPGTAADNSADRVAKGRSRHSPSHIAALRASVPRGEKQHLAKLTGVDVREIRRLRASGLSYQAIADRYRVSRTTIRAIFTGRTWAHVA